MVEYSPEAKIVYEKFEHMNPGGCLQDYAEFASVYDKGLLEIGYLDPQIGAAQIKKQGLPSDALIADVGSGTGLVGIELKKLGYNNLIGLDASKEMREIAEERKIYKEVNEFFLMTGQAEQMENKFDAAVSAGVFATFHIDAPAINDLLTMIKPGGIAVICLRKDSNVFLEYAKELAAQGKWTLIEEEPYRKYDEFCKNLKEDSKFFFAMDAVAAVFKKN